MSETDYDIVFDGSHQHRDADLLCAPKIPTKRAAPPIPLNPAKPGFLIRARGRAETDPAYAAVRDCLVQQACTVPQLVRVTGYSSVLVNLALQRLRNQGVLVGVPLPREERGPGKPWTAFRVEG